MSHTQFFRAWLKVSRDCSVCLVHVLSVSPSYNFHPSHMPCAARFLTHLPQLTRGIFHFSLTAISFNLDAVRCSAAWPIRRTILFTGDELNAPIEVSSDATPVVLPSRRCSLELTADDLATALDASEAGDRSDVGRLASPLFPQEREVSANTFGASFSHSHSSIEKSRRDMNQRASIETSMTRKSSRDSGSVQGSQ